MNLVYKLGNAVVGEGRRCRWSRTGEFAITGGHIRAKPNLTDITTRPWKVIWLSGLLCLYLLVCTWFRILVVYLRDLGAPGTYMRRGFTHSHRFRAKWSVSRTNCCKFEQIRTNLFRNRNSFRKQLVHLSFESVQFLGKFKSDQSDKGCLSKISFGKILQFSSRRGWEFSKDVQENFSTFRKLEQHWKTFKWLNFWCVPGICKTSSECTVLCMK